MMTDGPYEERMFGHVFVRPCTDPLFEVCHSCAVERKLVHVHFLSAGKGNLVIVISHHRHESLWLKIALLFFHELHSPLVPHLCVVKLFNGRSLGKILVVGRVKFICAENFPEVDLVHSLFDPALFLCETYEILGRHVIIVLYLKLVGTGSNGIIVFFGYPAFSGNRNQPEFIWISYLEDDAIPGLTELLCN